MPQSQVSRRAFLLGASFPFFPFFRRTLSIAGQKFRIVRHGPEQRHYFWVHGNEQTAQSVLREHMKIADGRAFLVENNVRNIRINGGQLDPNRMFSRTGAEKNLRTLNPKWTDAERQAALDRLDRDRPRFVKAILPPKGRLLVALHNNSQGYSMKDEVPISDAVALNNSEHPHEFMLCTQRVDFDKLADSPFNVLLQNTAPKEDDGSLSRLAAVEGVRYVNIEAALGNAAGQIAMLSYLEKALAI